MRPRHPVKQADWDKGRRETGYRPHLLEMGVEIENDEEGIRAETLAPHTQG